MIKFNSKTENIKFDDYANKLFDTLTNSKGTYNININEVKKNGVIVALRIDINEEDY